MKHLVCSTLCLLMAASVLAAPEPIEPQITEIRLVDNPGFVRAPRPLSEFVFHADDTFDWTGGNDTTPVHHTYSLRKGEFQKLVASLDNQKFFDLEPKYPTGPMIADVASFTISVTRDDEKKQVEYLRIPRPEGEPLNLWITEKLLRGVAWDAIQKQTPQIAR